MLICLQCDRLSPARGVPFCTILAHMAGAKLYRSYGLITDELIKPGRASLAISPSPWRVPPSPKWASLAWASQFCTVWGCENKLPVSFQTHLFIFSNSHNSDVGLKWHTEGPGHVDLFFCVSLVSQTTGISSSWRQAHKQAKVLRFRFWGEKMSVFHLWWL